MMRAKTSANNARLNPFFVDDSKPNRQLTQHANFDEVSNYAVEGDLGAKRSIP